MEFQIAGVGVSDLVKKYGSPLYVYDKDLITKNYQSLKDYIPYPKLKIKYACKANSSMAILKHLAELGSGIDSVSPGEVFLALKAGFKASDIVFTGDNSTEEHIEYCMQNNVMVNIGSLFQLELFGKKYRGEKVMIRVNPDVGDGHHEHCITGGPESKFGIYITQIEEAKKIAKEYDLKIVGIHSHIGTGILNTKSFMDATNIILEEAKKFDDLDIIDLGGGMGIPYKDGESPLDMKDLGEKFVERIEQFNKEYNKEVTLYMEPGRFIVGNAGYLLVEAVNKKETPMFKFVGVNSGFNHLIRPMAYGSHHRIFNGSKMDEGETENLVVAGNLCESGDIFSRIDGNKAAYPIRKVDYKDILVIREAGAYGFSMASNYNSYLLPAEVMVENGKAALIRERQTNEDLLKGQIY